MTVAMIELIRMRSLGANVGATRANDLARHANESGQASGDHASSRTDPNDAERLTGIYGLKVCSCCRATSDPRSLALSAVRFGLPPDRFVALAVLLADLSIDISPYSSLWRRAASSKSIRNWPRVATVYIPSMSPLTQRL